MFDSQKLSFDKFLLGYKHGIYIFSEDSCHICHEYKKTIQHINNANLYFVDVNTELQKKAIYQLTDRNAFPQTACFKDNELQYVRLGQLFDLQLEEIWTSLNEFGENPLSQSEIEDRIKKQKTRCKLAFYVLPDNCNFQTRMKIHALGNKLNYLPLDVDMLAPTLSVEEREHMLDGNYLNAELVVYFNNESEKTSFTELGQLVTMKYTAKNKNVKFIVRSIENDLKEFYDNRDNTDNKD